MCQGAHSRLPDGFAGTFTSRYVDTGELREHLITGGDGPPLLLVHGWPQTWYAWRLVMPALARHSSVVAPDQRGRGLSGKPHDGYDTAALPVLGHANPVSKRSEPSAPGSPLTAARYARAHPAMTALPAATSAPPATLVSRFITLAPGAAPAVNWGSPSSRILPAGSARALTIASPSPGQGTSAPNWKTCMPPASKSAQRE
jgi:hypothetical protein